MKRSYSSKALHRTQSECFEENLLAEFFPSDNNAHHNMTDNNSDNEHEDNDNNNTFIQLQNNLNKSEKLENLSEIFIKTEINDIYANRENISDGIDTEFMIKEKQAPNSSPNIYNVNDMIQSGKSLSTSAFTPFSTSVFPPEPNRQTPSYTAPNFPEAIDGFNPYIKLERK